MTGSHSGAGPVLDARAEEIAQIDDALVMDVAGVAQAADEMRRALDLLDGHLDARAFGRAAQLGYGEIASAFVFLQRTLGALQGSEQGRSGLVSEVAAEMGWAWEEAEPHVAARMASLRPLSGGKADGEDGASHVDRPAIVTPAGRVTVPRAVLDALALGPGQGLRFAARPDGHVAMTVEDHPGLRGLQERLHRMEREPDAKDGGPTA